MSGRKALHWIAVALLLATTCLPYVWYRLVHYRLSNTAGDFGSAALWLIILLVILLTFTENRGIKRWWPVMTAPVALFPASVRIFTLVVWKLHGFAP